MEFSVDTVKNAIKSDDALTLLRQFASVQSKESETSLVEYFEIIAKDEATKCWNSVKTSVEGFVNKFSNTPSSQMTEESIHADIQLLQGVITAMNAFVKKNKVRVNGMLQTLDCLQNLLEVLHLETVPVLAFKNNLSFLCEQWYLRNEPGGNQLLPQLMTYLLMESLKPTSKEATIKRLYTVRQGFNELDIANAGKDFKRELLLRCYVHPTFLKSADGQKLLSILLTASEGLLLEPVITLVKAQICNGNKSLAVIYGEMLQRVWKDSPVSNTVDNSKSAKQKLPVIDKLRLSIEDSMQELIDEATHSSDPKYFRGLRFLVKAFHDVKRTEQLDEMLVKIFEPILWRSLRCANAIVRSQASVLFLDVFPLQKTNAKPEECDMLLQKQFDQLTSLLKDGDHRVRATATSGVCHILREYWDILPAGTVQNLLKYIFETLAFDVSSANVRHSVICGVQEILQQPLSHQALKALMPLIANLIHDKAEKNRLAFIRLLNDIKNIKGIHFYEVVSVEHLMERFAEDRENEAISSAMCELLLSSFFPQRSKADGGSDGKDQVNRCIKFVNENAIAAEAFYKYLHNHVSVGGVTKLIVMLFHVLHSNVIKFASIANNPASQADASKGKRKRGENHHIDTATDEPCMSKATMFGISRVILALLQSVQSQLSDESACLELLFKFFAPEKVIGWMETLVLTFSEDSSFIATSLQIVSVIVKLSNEVEIEGVDLENIKNKFSATYILNEVLPASLLAVHTDSAKKWLCRAAIEIIFAANQELECAKALKKSIEQYGKTFKSTKSKSTSKESALSIDVASFALITFTEFICNPHYSSQAGNKLSEELERVWQLLMSTITSILVSDQIEQVTAKDIESLSIATKAYFTCAVFEDVSQALINDADEATFNALTRGSTWVRENILPHCINPESLVQIELAQNIVSMSVLALTDALHLMNDKDHVKIVSLITSLLDNLNVVITTNESAGEFVVCWHQTSAFSKFAMVMERIASVLSHLVTTVEPEALSDMITAMIASVKNTVDFLPQSEKGPSKAQLSLQRVFSDIIKKCFVESDHFDHSAAFAKVAMIAKGNTQEVSNNNKKTKGKAKSTPSSSVEKSLVGQLLSKELANNSKLSEKFSSFNTSSSNNMDLNQENEENNHQNQPIENKAIEKPSKVASRRNNNMPSVLLGVH